MKYWSKIEVLEGRIAPAVLFVQTDAKVVLTSDGENAEDLAGETEARIAAGADVAVLLGKGDLLVLDVNNNQILDSGDIPLAQVGKGQAMIFLTDLGGATPGAFDADEVTGVAVSAKFAGTFDQDIRGSVVTALNADGALTLGNGNVLQLQEAAVASLSVKGRVDGSIVAGGAISNVAIGDPASADSSEVSVERILTGSAGNGASVSFNGGAVDFTVSTSELQSPNGPGITKVTLAAGAESIRAGDGRSVSEGKAGAGGAISRVTVLASPVPVSIVAGNGGDAGANGTGGAGGSLTKIAVVQTGASGISSDLLAGVGGDSDGGKAGQGGSVIGLELTSSGEMERITITGGGGGAGMKAGAGGGIRSVSVDAVDVQDWIIVSAANGGAAVGTDAKAAKGARGGAAQDVQLTGEALSSMEISAGSGSYAQVNGRGGQGGAVAKASIVHTGEAPELNLLISGGSGGDGAGAKGAGGAGGAVLASNISAGGVDSISVQAGRGGSSTGVGAKSGGALSSFTLEVKGEVLGPISLGSGHGGSSTSGTGGASGAVSKVAVDIDAEISTLSINSGTGGSTASGSKAGNSGAVSKVSIESDADITSAAQIFSGGNGLVTTGSGITGDSGDVKKISIIDRFGAAGTFQIFSGKNKMAAEGQRGNSGNISGVTLDAPDSTVRLGYGTLGFDDSAGDGETRGPGGNGGNISNVSGRVGTIDIAAPSGGAGTIGGKGGSVSNINLTGVEEHARLIAAGGGGDGTERGGAGGSIKNVRIAGDIGDFDQSFQILDGGMGGLSAGQGGSGPQPGVNGGIAKVAAERIAAIIAGRPVDASSITYSNAVAKLSDINAATIGADIGNDGVFTFTEGPGGTPGFQPDEEGNATHGDTAIDGFVLVKESGLKGTLDALKLIRVD